VAPDPRVWAVHKLWLSRRPDRQPIKRQRDATQAEAVGALVATYLTHLPFEAEHLRMLPKDLMAEASPLFQAKATSPGL
jgi:hypothetical protein